MRTLTIGKRTISRGQFEKPYLVAEAGVNHEGDLDKARLMIQQAAHAGADAVKFQTYKAEKLASKHSPAYWDTTKEPTRTQYELFKKHDQFWRDEFETLADCATECGIDFLSTPFDFEAVDLLEDLVPAYKVASADITNYPLLRHIASKGKPIFLSTGGATISEIYQALEVINQVGNSQVAILHCILNYPTPLENANIGMIHHMMEVFPDYVIGYSDHTLPEVSKEILIVAWLLGAQIIEKHFTFDKSLPGNDHYHAFDEADLKAFVERLALTLTAMGSFKKDYLPEEEKSRLNARRSLVAVRSISKGEKFARRDIAIKRPGTGIPPALLDAVVGSEALRDIAEDEVITYDAIRFLAPRDRGQG
jgi:N-acetylneuraminate synthase